ncbi:MAG: hypothetical protein CRN43_08785, partial [Candidatus Nephrothrix sp. EaCA]
MEKLKEIVSISGKSGLYKALKPGQSGMLVESLEDKGKSMLNISRQIMRLSEISIYTTTKEGTIALSEALERIRKEFGATLAVTSESSPDELKAFMLKAVPEYDPARVYISDIKKLVKWYSLLSKSMPEL